MDILKRAEGFEALAGAWEDAKNEARPTEYMMRQANAQALLHAAKLAHKASEELAKGRKQQAKMAATLALETLQEIVAKLQ
jgi:hypothetical protein